MYICIVMAADKDTGLENKLHVFKEKTGTKKTLFLTMVTTYGTKDNVYKTGIIQNEVMMEDLFKR